MNEFNLTVPTEYFNLIFKGQSLCETRELSIEMNDYQFKLVVDCFSRDSGFRLSEMTSSISGHIIRVKTEKDKLKDELDILLQKVESVKEKLKSLK